LRILEKIFIPREENLKFDLAFVPIKGKRNDYLIEKATELGVNKFFIFYSAASVIKKMGISKIEHLKNITISAMLQSLQYYQPEIVVLDNIDKLLSIFPEYNSVVVADQQGDTKLPNLKERVLYIVGPEGGFENYEIEKFIESGAKPISLGKKRLRSETAAIVGIVKILTALESKEN